MSRSRRRVSPPPAATLTGRAGPITVTGVNRLTDTDFESTFTPTRARPSGPVARRVKFATLSTAAGEVPTRTYQAMVTEWQLSFRLRDAGGSDFDAALNGLEIVRVS